MGFFSRLGAKLDDAIASVGATVSRAVLSVERALGWEEKPGEPAAKTPPALPTVTDELKTAMEGQLRTVLDEQAREEYAERLAPVPEEPDYDDRESLDFHQAIGALKAAGLDPYYLEQIALVHEEIGMDDAAMMIASLLTPGGRSPKSAAHVEDVEHGDDEEPAPRRWFESGKFRHLLFALLELAMDDTCEIEELEFQKGEPVTHGRRRKLGEDGKPVPLPPKQKRGPRAARSPKLSKAEHEKALAAERARRYRQRQKQKKGPGR